MKKFINVINIYTILNIFKNRTFKATNFESFEKKNDFSFNYYRKYQNSQNS